MTEEKNQEMVEEFISDSVTEEPEENDAIIEEDEVVKEENPVIDQDVKEAVESIKIEKQPEEEQSKEEPAGDDLFNEFRSFLEKRAGIVEDHKVKQVIPTGIDVLDAILGGGFAVGVLNIIVGQPGSGKSMLAMQTMAQGQKQYKGRMLCAYLDSEESTTTVRLSNLGVKYPKIKPYTDITIEKVFKFLEGMSVFKEERKIKEPSIVVWDSIANTLSEKEREASDPNQVIGYKARLLSILIPKYVAKCSMHDICFLAVNQLRDTLAMGPYATPKDLKLMSASKEMPGGNILKFNAFQLVEMKIKSVIADANADKFGFEGIIVKAKCVKNKLFPPNVEIEMVGSFTSGFSNFWTNYMFLAKHKRLQTGAWNYLVSKPETKFRTKDALKLYLSDESFKQEFDKEVKDTIQKEIVEKYNPVIE